VSEVVPTSASDLPATVPTPQDVLADLRRLETVVRNQLAA
jgi:hypothetical protein